MKRVAARRPASSRARAEPHLENGRVYRCESEPEDGKRGPYSHDQLLQMNARFVQRLERAFANGDESRAAASATYRKVPAGPLMPPVERGDG